MKLLCLFVVLLLWQIIPLRTYTQKIPLLNLYMDYLKSFFERIEWFRTVLGSLMLVLIASLLLSVIGGLISIEVLQFIYECLILWFTLCSLQTIPFHALTPDIQLEQASNALFAKLPASVWQINYYWVVPFFSYILFGVFGLVFYWAVCYLGNNAQMAKKNLMQNMLESIVWAPARLLAFAYAVVGNFSKGMQVFSEYFGADTTYNQYILLQTVFVSVEDKAVENSLTSCARLQRDAQILLLAVYILIVVLTWLI